MLLPQITNNISKSKSEIVAMRGINWSDQLQDGDMANSMNLSARRYPYISTRRAREKQKKTESEYYSGGTALTAWGKLVAVEGTNLLYDGEVVGQVTAGEKQFAVVNTKMVIWPDKVYLDIKDQQVKPLAAELSGSKATFATNKITVNGWADLTTKFKAGDGVTLSGCTSKPENNKDFVIKAVTSNTITVADNTFVAVNEASTAIKLERKIPDLDFICESENRLWGCDSDTQTIYASALGDPTNFYVYEGLSTDAYTLAVGTEGKFTGCCKLSSSVLFWKETKLHKMLGSYPAEYAMYTYEMEGLGHHGVYAYSGGTPTLISDNFGEKEFTDAIAGNDGDSYYLSVKDGAAHKLMVYETKTGIWVLEDGTEAVDFARIGKDLYMLDGSGDVYLLDGAPTPKDQRWVAQFTPMYETIDGKKTYSKLLVRLELPAGSHVIAKARFDGKSWQECGRVAGRDYNVTAMRIATNRCDKFELRLEGEGECTILGISREFIIGSDVK